MDCVGVVGVGKGEGEVTASSLYGTTQGTSRLQAEVPESGGLW